MYNNCSCFETPSFRRRTKRKNVNEREDLHKNFSTEMPSSKINKIETVHKYPNSSLRYSQYINMWTLHQFLKAELKKLVILMTFKWNSFLSTIENKGNWVFVKKTLTKLEWTHYNSAYFSWNILRKITLQQNLILTPAKEPPLIKPSTLIVWISKKCVLYQFEF